MRLIILFIFFLGFVPVATYAQDTETDPLDIIIEADTLVPSFYNGRAEPTQGSRIRAIAIPAVANSTYRYDWSVNGVRIGDKTHEVSFIAPMGKTFRISVTVLDTSGSSVLREEEYVSLSETHLIFYESSLLYGISPRAIGTSMELIGDEVTIQAVPYFMDLNAFRSTANQFRWTVADREISSDQLTDRDVLTVRKNSPNGSSVISLTIQNTQMLSQNLHDKFTLVF